MDPFDSVTIASVCMNVFRTKFIEEEWRLKLEGRHSWIPAKLTDQKFYILWENEWIHETELVDEKVSVKEFVCTPIAKIPPSGYNDQYSKASIQWLEWMTRVNNITIQHALNTGEKSIPGTRYKFDGYSKETNTALNTMVASHMDAQTVSWITVKKRTIHSPSNLSLNCTL